jgi:hypothetical protein
MKDLKHIKRFSVIESLSDDYFSSQEILDSIKPFGFTGNSIEEALFFCDEKINDYWVDAPVRVRDEGMKEMAEYCTLFQTYKNILLRIKRSQTK